MFVYFLREAIRVVVSLFVTLAKEDKGGYGGELLLARGGSRRVGLDIKTVYCEWDILGFTPKVYNVIYVNGGAQRLDTGQRFISGRKIIRKEDYLLVRKIAHMKKFSEKQLLLFGKLDETRLCWRKLSFKVYP